MKNNNTSISIGTLTLWSLALFSVGLIVYRFIFGLGAVTNLSDGYPWGFWIAIDILAGIALAAGGFVMAGTVYLFGGRQYHALARPAVLTAFLGYLLFIGGLLVDLGRPWNLYQVIFSWNHDSPLFEVGWCVMMYTFVLLLELLPAVFERWHMEKIHALWKSLTAWLIILMLGFFTFAMTNSFIWTGVMVAILLVWEICMRFGIMPRNQQMPILLIMAGVIFSTLHQSSLGSLYLLLPHKLHVLWYSPFLPIFFFLSAVMVGPAMVTFEALCSENLLGHKTKLSLLSSLSRIMPILLGMYLLLKVGDLVVRGVAQETFHVDYTAIFWWLEISIGILLPIALYRTPDIISKQGGLFLASFFVVLGIIINRVNVAIIGMQIAPKYETYYPHWAEIFITIGIFSMGLLVFQWTTNHLPINEESSYSASH